jgi:predicted ATPase
MRELCQQVGDTPQIFPVLEGLWLFHLVRGELPAAQELMEQRLHLAQHVQDPALLVPAHLEWGMTLYFLGEFAPAREQVEQGLALYDPQQYRSQAFHAGHDYGVVCLAYLSWVLWVLGYPARSLKSINDALALARDMSRPYSLTLAQTFAAELYQFRREAKLSQEWAEAAITLSTEQGFPQWVVGGTLLRSWALAAQGYGEEGITQMRRVLGPLAAAQAIPRRELTRPYDLALLAEAYGKMGQVEEGLAALAEALTVVDKSGARFHEAELYRLKGELTLQQSDVRRPQHQSPTPSTQTTAEAEAYFQKAIDIARKQQAKSWELRAVMSLAQLWQKQGKKAEARQMLAEIYDWFTEGFDTTDFQEAKALLEEFS